MWDTYPELSRDLNATGRPIVYSCSQPSYLDPDYSHQGLRREQGDPEDLHRVWARELHDGSYAVLQKAWSMGDFDKISFKPEMIGWEEDVKYT